MECDESGAELQSRVQTRPNRRGNEAAFILTLNTEQAERLQICKTKEAANS